MGKQSAKYCVLHVGDGGKVAISGSTYAIDENAGVFKITDSGASLVTDGAVVGALVTVSGFSDANNNFQGLISAAAEGELTIVSPVHPEDRNDLTPVDESAGATITLTIEKFNLLSGQDDTSYDKSGTEVEQTTKDSAGNNNESEGGTTTISVSVSGKVKFPDTSGWKVLNDSIDAGSKVMCKLVLNQEGDYYYGPFLVASQGGGGGKDDSNSYSFSLSGAGRYLYQAAS